MSPFILMLLDHGFTIFHLLLTGFNVSGWMWARTRRAHRWCVGITAACWLTIGPLFYGTLGYCPLTDWHWRIKAMRGQTDLPDSFITLLLNQIGLYPAAQSVDMLVGVVFAFVVLVTLYLWRRDWPRRGGLPTPEEALREREMKGYDRNIAVGSDDR